MHTSLGGILIRAFWLMLLTVVAVMPTTDAVANPRDAVIAETRVQPGVDLNQILEDNGWTVLALPSNMHLPGKLFKPGDSSAQGTCVDATPVTGDLPSIEAQGAKGFVVEGGAGIGVMSGSGEIQATSFKLKSTTDVEQSVIEGFDMTLNERCLQKLRDLQARGTSIAGWFVVQEVARARVKELKCSSKEAAAKVRALWIARGEVGAMSECVESSEVTGVIAYKAKPVLELMPDTGPKAEVQLGGEAVDFGAVAAGARAAGDGPAGVSTGTAQTVLGGGDGDLAAMAAQAKAQEAERARTEAALAAEEARLAKEAARLKAVREAERKRQAEEAAELKRRMEAERKRRISEARETLLAKAKSDMQPLEPLLTGPMSSATKQALQTYLSRYRSAKITVDGTTESVTIPAVARIDRALVKEAAREKAALAAARQKKLDEEKAALLARAKKDFATIAPLLEGEVSKEVRPVLQAFVERYSGAKVRVDDVEQAVVVPGLAKVQAKLGQGAGGARGRLSAGISHTCGVLENGTVKCWGWDKYGQTRAPSGAYRSVSAGGGHTCGVLESGAVKCWGHNGYNVRSEVPLGAYRSVSAGDSHACGVLESGTVKCWGKNGDWNYAPSGVYQSVSAGSSHTCGVLESGTVKCWGNELDGRTHVPSGVYRSVSAGDSHTCGVLESGTVKCWGKNGTGQTRVPPGAYRSVSAGGHHTCGVLESGTVKCWGWDKDGQTRAPSGVYRSVSAGYSHTCGVLESGTVKCWGRDEDGQATPPPGIRIAAGSNSMGGGDSAGGSTSMDMKFVSIAAGSFMMGVSRELADKMEGRVRYAGSDRRVSLSNSFLMATTEVTQGQWRAVMGSNPSHFSSCGADCPVEQVTWYDAVKFANAMSKKEGLRAAYQIYGKSVRWDKSANGYRLPTEAEWEYAARGGQRHLYSGSNTVSEVGWLKKNSGSKTHKVASKRANAWGLYDMSGNVSEWCWDAFGGAYGDHYGQTDPVRAYDGESRITRGGSWRDELVGAVVGGDYLFWRADSYKRDRGLRLVRSNP